MSHVSIVIPTLNEQTSLGRTLRQLTLLNPPAWEILVVDGGSCDQTVAIAHNSLELFNGAVNVQVLLKSLKS
ncbi:glycosyltransferase [Nodularia spumigena]|jgi:glycosyltransferase involved in cell wall biosynthesis|uniref:4,4'-diaponeurosporenoate glycosyltransferase n=1 Tax=Nodularia spumigena UHCC 0060 TaxID=3110300 RepID=A0ABU5UV98_NODSP|nr:glycosyltransferase [Nodularia spumigena]MEA5526323.1 glycosyltransferase [Nodularia spumigena UHCC 0143]MEA5609465.1 glycosyltransferase [Nodularia spumigena UHCC 0060]MEA5613430.1 glycosyltransferase [Nodularia spumigena UHCC 0040]